MSSLFVIVLNFLKVLKTSTGMLLVCGYMNTT